MTSFARADCWASLRPTSVGEGQTESCQRLDDVEGAGSKRDEKEQERVAM